MITSSRLGSAAVLGGACLSAAMLVIWLGAAWSHGNRSQKTDKGEPNPGMETFSRATPSPLPYAQPAAPAVRIPQNTEGSWAQVMDSLSKINPGENGDQIPHELEDPRIVSDARHLAREYQEAVHTFGSKSMQENLMRSIYQNPEIHRFVMKAMVSLDLAARLLGEDQARARALFGDYLHYLGARGKTIELAKLLRDISLDLAVNGDRKGRRLDLEDAFLGWLAAIGKEKILSAPEQALGNLSMTATGWKVATLVLSDEVSEIWDSEHLHQRVMDTVRARTIQ